MTREELKEMIPIIQAYVDDEKKEVISNELDIESPETTEQ